MGFSRCGNPASLRLFSTTFRKIVVEVMTSILPQLLKLWFLNSKGMLPVKQIALKILMGINYCGRKIARKFGWTNPAYHKKEGATPHS